MGPMRVRTTPPGPHVARDARVIVRESMRATATTMMEVSASSPLVKRNGGVGIEETERLAPSSASSLVCREEIDGRKWEYEIVARGDLKGRRFGKGMIKAVSLQNTADPVQELLGFVKSYALPEGFPDSVIPSYAPYMTWRALKHFFGGAMAVHTTRTLLNSVGVSRDRAASGAVAINWILKDGAGRVGKLIFARQGKKFDYDLKQLRFAGDLLLELGAGIELATSVMPHLFLPLACTANVVKNVAAVTSTSTRTPIYKAFAKGENIGDVTAKGECVSNIADLMGTGFSIMISKNYPNLTATFALLSCGYLLSSYQEVKSVVLHTLNKTRFTVAVESFLKTGCVPSLQEGNSKEKIYTLPWWKNKSVVLGSRFGEAFQDPASFLSIHSLFEKEKYIVTYNPVKRNVYALLKDQAKSDDILKAAFHAYVLLHSIDSSTSKWSSKKSNILDNSNLAQSLSSHLLPTNLDFSEHIAESCKTVSTSYDEFKRKAAEQGWIMSESLLNPGRARLCFE